MPTPRKDSDRPRWFLMAWGLTLAAAMVATWRLWTPWRETPRLAPIEPLTAIPSGTDLALLAVLMFGLVRVLRLSCRWRSGVTLMTVALTALLAMDQLRWQPWAYHACLAGVMLAAAPTATAWQLLRWMSIAVYAYSAIAKLDAEFAATLGPQMLGAIGLPAQLAITLPLGELGVAALLAASLFWQRLRQPACVAAVVMHATTIGVLGPWALGHSLGVLVWNAGFAWQTVALFGTENQPSDLPTGRPRPAALAALGLAVVAPVLTPLCLWDQWPGWALYAPGGERATLLVHTAAVDRLPESLADFTDKPNEGPWCRVRLDDWALASTGAPIYPQNRIVAAVAAGLAERYPLSGRVRVVIESAANRFTRERTNQTLEDTRAINDASKLFGLPPGVRWPR